MKCPHLTQFGDVLAPCGQCMACRINKKRLWTGRILLEATHNQKRSSFVTLTYSDDYLPKDGSVDPEHIKTFLDRLRHRKEVDRLRYYAVGEYGDKTERPHYHLALFGMEPEVYEPVIEKCWQDKEKKEPIGHVHIGEIEPQSAAYICGYATKKMTNKNDARLKGRHPEFTRMSKNKPLGFTGMNQIRKMLYTERGSLQIATHGDVPHQYRCYGKLWPIGTYWLKRLREEFNITNPPKNNEWIIDPEGFELGQKKAQEQNAKLWRRRNRSSNRQI